jgi:hypothetical protein
MVLYLKGAISIVMVLYLKGGDFLCFLDRFITLEGERDYTRLPAAPESDASASAGAIETQSAQMTLIELCVPLIN